MAKIADFSAIQRTLKIANYRNYLAGNFCSQLGMWVQRLAVQWLTWQLTKDPFWLGVIAFADFFPNVIMAPLAGALADRLERLPALRHYMFISCSVATALAVLVLTGTITIHLLLILVVLNGTAMAFTYPVRLSLIYSLVGRAALTSAIGINALAFNIARIGGPALAGFLISHWEVGPAFVFKAVADSLFIITLYRTRLAARETMPAPQPLKQIPSEIMEGYRYARSHPGIGPLLVILMVTTIFARPVNDLYAGFADDVFGRGADGLAWLTGMLGFGAMIGSVYLATRESVEGLTNLLVKSVLVFVVSLIAFTATNIFWFALICTAFSGLSVVIVGVAQQTLLQAAVASEMRGRMLSLYTLIARGFPSVGALIMGSLASFVGLRWPVFGGAVICLGLWVWARRRQKLMERSLEGGVHH